MLVLKNKNQSGLNGGLNGFWGKLAKKLIGMALNAIKSVPILGPTVSEELGFAIQDLTNNYGADGDDGTGSWWQKTASNYEPNASEEIILTTWTQTFSIFYKALATELANAVNQSDLSNKVTGINAVLNKMCVIRSHYAKYDSSGLSPDAVIYRNDLITELFKPLENVITTQNLESYGLMKSNISFTIPSSLTGYSPLMSSTPLTTVQCSNYFTEVILIDPRNPTVPLPPIGIKPKPASGDAPTVLPVGAENTIPKTLPTTGSSTNKKSFIQKNGIYIIGGVAAAVVLLSGKKKKKKI